MSISSNPPSSSTKTKYWQIAVDSFSLTNLCKNKQLIHSINETYKVSHLAKTLGTKIDLKQYETHRQTHVLKY